MHSTKYPALFAALAAPFEPDEVKVRSQGGRQLHYVTSRTVMNRFDDVFGPENWWDDYVPMEHSVVCRLTVRLPGDDGTLTKTDAGGMAGMADPGDDDKSGFADAFKRAAVKFGCGRYLYRDGLPAFVREILRDGNAASNAALAPQGAPQQADQPARQSAPPARQESRGAAPAGGNGRSGGYDSESVPGSGRGLFAWCKKRQEADGEDWVRRVNGLGEAEGLPKKMIEWSESDVARIFGLVTGTANAGPATAGAKRLSSMVADDEIPY